MMKLWGGRFKKGLDEQAWALNASLAFDRRLAAQDVRGSLSWAKALYGAGVLLEEELAQIQSGLQQIATEFEGQSFVFQESDEDIHTAVERRLGELIGLLAGKLHTGRSRNDQVVTDLRLWVLEHIALLQRAIADLQAALIGRAEADFQVIMPGYTHLQPAQPILLSHWWLSHFWPLARDRERLGQLAGRTASLPLGAGALAGTPYPVDRVALAADLGFNQPSANSLDSVSDRDFAAEFLFCAALAGVHLSRLAEAVILFTSAEFGFLELDDLFATGSSLMPQKKNPDVFELARGKSGALLGYLAGLLATLKALPSAYDKDLQEDKLPVFRAYDLLAGLLPVLANAIRTIKIHPERMEARLEAGLLSTDLADYLVRKGRPFRQAHQVVGKAVQRAAETGKSIAGLSLAEFQSLDALFAEDVFMVFDPAVSISLRNATGGTAPQAVKQQILAARDALNAA